MKGNGSRYDKEPRIHVSRGEAWQGWQDIGTALAKAVSSRSASKTVVAVDCYHGVDGADILAVLTAALGPSLVIESESACKTEAAVQAMVGPYLTDDRVFGRMNGLEIGDFFDPAAVEKCRREVDAFASGVVFVFGVGASLLAKPDILVYADMARWEIQLRFRHRGLGNWLASNPGEDFLRKYKRGYFVDWRVLDRHKAGLFDRIDFLLDTNKTGRPAMLSGDGFRAGLDQACRQPFRVVPFFDPGPWGGQWMKKVCGLDETAPNYAWCFDCVPEENSLLLEREGISVEIPSLDLVLYRPQALLGEDVFSRYGAEFPIRFDFLDTMGGGNLSLQVHPTAAYIREQFGMSYTQDESYYLLDAESGCTVYLGLRDDADQERMLEALETAQSGGALFDAEAFVNRWPAAKHDHFLIPSGTVHCSGAGGMVLEISATPYIFTFKLWDWGRLGLDGKPRPIHLGHGRRVIQWDRRTDWVRDNLVNRVEQVAQGEGWREERTGLHSLEPIETRRHWFTNPVLHDTGGTLNVLNLVEGSEALVTSPAGEFKPFTVHYAETFIIPAAVGQYTIGPSENSAGQTLGTVKAWIRPI